MVSAEALLEQVRLATEGRPQQQRRVLLVALANAELIIRRAAPVLPGDKIPPTMWLAQPLSVRGTSSEFNAITALLEAFAGCVQSGSGEMKRAHLGLGLERRQIRLGRCSRRCMWCLHHCAFCARLLPVTPQRLVRSLTLCLVQSR
jgi:hypothetical protein